MNTRSVKDFECADAPAQHVIQVKLDLPGRLYFVGNRRTWIKGIGVVLFQADFLWKGRLV